MSAKVMEAANPDRGMYIREIAEMFGQPQEFVRAACHRGPEHHPLPHTPSGKKRPVLRIRPSVFAAWLEEEERLVAYGQVERG